MNGSFGTKRHRPRVVLPVLVGFLLSLGFVSSSPAVAALSPASPGHLTNLAHLDFLGATITPPRQADHTTYRLEQEPSLQALWVYAEPDAGVPGGYRRVGGGAYNAGTNTYGQGAYDTDDLTRAAVVYTRHWQQFGDAHSRDAAYGLLRTITYMQTLSNDARRGNFVLWMQPDGTLNPSADPKESPDPSDSGQSYWLARSIWALGEGYAAFRTVNRSFAQFLQDRLRLALQAVDREALVRYGTHQMFDGARMPAWLINDGADASSEAIYGLSAYVRAAPEDRAARRDLERLAEGVAQMALTDDPDTWSFGAILPFTGSRSMWHSWGDQMAGALATAGSTLHDQRFIAAATHEVATFVPHLLVQGGADQAWLPAPIDLAQIAYGADATLQNLLRTADASGRPGLRSLAAIEAAWYCGNNRSGVQMYDPATGVTFDGLESNGNVNHNSGAESTIEGLLSMLALDAHPDVAALATSHNVRVLGEQQSWTLLEAEAATLGGQTTVVTPASAWTGESQWSGGKYVEMLPGGRLTLTVTLPQAGRYLLLPVFDRQRAPLQAVGNRFEIGSSPRGVAWQGGAGKPGASTTDGYLDIGNVGSGGVIPAGQVSITATYAGDGRPARLDAVLLQPEIEQIILAGTGGRQGLLHSWATERRVTTVNAGTHGMTAFAYSADGRLAETVSGTGSLAVPVAPHGFTYLIER